MTNPVGPRRARKAAMSPGDGPTIGTPCPRRRQISCDQFGPWVYLNNYKASYFYL